MWGCVMSVLSWPTGLAALLAVGCTGSLSVFPTDSEPMTGSLPLQDSGSSSERTDDGTNAPKTGEPIALYAIDPSVGTDAGGQQVRLTGVFRAGVEVRIGGELASIDEIGDGRIVATTPSSTVLGAVGVEVRAPDAAPAALAGGFTYFRDAAGQAGIIGMIGRYDVQGDYWVGDNDDFGFGAVAVVDGPSDWSYDQGFSDVIGGCRYQEGGDSWPADPALLDLGVSSLGFRTTSTDFSLADGDVVGGWYTGDLDATDLVAGSSYTLESTPATASWPSFDLRDAAAIPIGFTLATPFLDTAELPTIARGTVLRWTGSGGHVVLIQIRREYQVAGIDVEDRVTCAVPDTGSFVIPAQTWPDWFSNDLLYIQVGRALVGGQSLVHNQAENRVAGVYWVFGAGLSL